MEPGNEDQKKDIVSMRVVIAAVPRSGAEVEDDLCLQVV